MGAITEIATSAPGYTSVRPHSAAPLAQVLNMNGYATAQFGKCHEIPVWQTSPVGPFDAWPTGGGGFEHFFGFLGGETNQYAPALYDGTTADRAVADRGGGVPLHRGHDRPGDRVGTPVVGADARPALLHVLRAGRDPRAASRAAGVGRSLHGPVRRRVGCAARADLRGAEAARCRAGRRGADRAARGDPGVGGHARRAQARPRPPDGGVRRLPRAHRPPRGPPDRRARRDGRAVEHAGLLHHRRQRGLGRGPHQRQLQRVPVLQRCGGARDSRVPAVADGPARHARGLQPLLGGLGARDGHALPVDQAGGLALGRHPQRHDHPLARGHLGARARCATSSIT